VQTKVVILHRGVVIASAACEIAAEGSKSSDTDDDVLESIAAAALASSLSLLAPKFESKST